MLSDSKLERACRLNRFYAFTVICESRPNDQPGWAHKFAEIAKLLSFSNPCQIDEKAFATKVANWQEAHGILPCDGILGQKTWAAIAAQISSGFSILGPLPIWLSFSAPFAAAQLAFCGSEMLGSRAIIPARGFLFIVGHVLPEVGQKNLVARVAVIPKDLVLHPTNRWANMSPAEHIIQLGLGESQYVNASNMPHGGIRNMMQDKQGVLIDIDKVKKAGGKVFKPKELVSHLNAIKGADDDIAMMIDDLIYQVKHEDGWSLVEGKTPKGAVRKLSPQHMKYLQASDRIGIGMQSMMELFPENTPDTIAQHSVESANLNTAYKNARTTGRLLRGMSVVGAAFTAYDVGNAAKESLDQNSIRPISAEGVRQVGGWASGVAGAKIGFVAGAAMGIETGPGAIITGGVGSLIVGAAGYAGADWVADLIYEN